MVLLMSEMYDVLFDDFKDLVNFDCLPLSDILN